MAKAQQANKGAAPRGHIERRGHSSWRVEVTLGTDPTTGRRKRLRVTVRGTEEDAQRKLTELLRQADLGQAVEPSRITVGEYLTQWLEAVKAQVAPGSMIAYSAMAKAMLETSVAGMRLQALTPLHVERAYGEMLASGLSPRTVAHDGVILSRALGDAVRWGLIPDNPASARRAKRPRWTPREMRALTADEARAVMAAAVQAESDSIGAKYARTVELALATGLRISEVLGLRWADVQETAISVRQILADGKTPGPTKSRAGMRTVPLPREAQEALRRQRLWQKEQRLAWGPGWKQTGYVFTHEDGSPIRRKTLETWYGKFIRRAGIAEPLPRFHDLRHTWATLQLKAGTPVHVVSRLLGHSSVTVTLSTYAHVLPEQQEQAAMAAGEWLDVQTSTRQ
ncbi:MAG: site-specific integrase [Firmicutes bacterium]|nr:site-specific integrase [Bacillota bacterium]